MDQTSSTHKRSQGTTPRSQSSASGSATASDLDEHNLEYTNFVVPGLHVVTPETLLTETFGKTACDSLPATFDPKALDLDIKRTKGKRFKKDMYPALVSLSSFLRLLG
jgi:hypothetical protein